MIRAIAQRGIEVFDQFGVVFPGDPIEEIGGNTVSGIVPQFRIMPLLQPNHVGAVAFGFVKKPTNVIGNPLDEPTG